MRYAREQTKEYAMHTRKRRNVANMGDGRNHANGCETGVYRGWRPADACCRHCRWVEELDGLVEAGQEGALSKKTPLAKGGLGRLGGGRVALWWRGVGGKEEGERKGRENKK